MNDNSSLLICAKVREMLVPTANSVRAVCSQCSETVWISEVGQKMLARNSDLQPTCWECSINSASRNEDVKAALRVRAENE